ncbi:MAG TPA: cation/multidrug efflux pump [Porticoccus sp.]|nr:cation/multidrug efflux pump [Porticoccus sp.]
MIYEGLASASVILGLLVCYLSLRLLMRAGWIGGWLRGMFGLLLVALGLTLGLLALDVVGYKQLISEKSVATLSFEKLAEQQYRVVMVDSGGEEHLFILKGDQWQLDARIVKWPGLLASWGMKPGYRLDRISGRYYSLEQEQNAERTVYSLNDSENPVDVWQWIRGYNENLPFVDAVYGSAAFLPMGDDALFEVTLSNTGLLARPLNDRAQKALDRWQ